MPLPALHTALPPCVQQLGAWLGTPHVSGGWVQYRPCCLHFSCMRLLPLYFRHVHWPVLRQVRTIRKGCKVGVGTAQPGLAKYPCSCSSQARASRAFESRTQAVTCCMEPTTTRLRSAACQF